MRAFGPSGGHRNYKLGPDERSHECVPARMDLLIYLASALPMGEEYESRTLAV